MEARHILDDIKETIENYFSITVSEYEEINKGLLNLKWKFITSNGLLFIKQYNSERNPVSKDQRLNTALAYQMRLSEKEIRCPHILTFQGDVILRTNQNIRFIVSEYCEGSLIHAGTINCCQSYDLGVELARVHRIINNQIYEKAIPSWVVPSKKQLLADWNKNWLLTSDKNTEDVNYYLTLQKEIFENIDINIFAECEQGWAHSDLWCDNILFYPESLSAILDFDRLQYIYPELDIARAILSFALEGDCLKRNEVKAFIDGYNQIANYSAGDVIRSLKLLYCLESFWWLRNERFKSEGPPKRFAEEMAWLTINWCNLEEMLC